MVRADLYLNIHNGAVDLFMKYLSAIRDPNILNKKKNMKNNLPREVVNSPP